MASSRRRKPSSDLARPRRPSVSVPGPLPCGGGCAYVHVQAPDDSADEDLPGPSRARPGLENFIKRLTFRQSQSSDTEPSIRTPQRRVSVSAVRPFVESPGPHGLKCVHTPTDPLVDLIFAHGLHGGSYKTWRKKEEEGYFWPGEWLPQDPEFQQVRIHTFGYPADWSDFKNRSYSVNDFGDSLASSMIGSPYLTRGEKV
jgi:hypothetical protein